MTGREVSSDVDTSPDAMLAYRLAKTIHRSGGNPSSLFGLLDRLVREQSWERLRRVDGEPFASFTEIVETPEPYGLGTTKTELGKLLELRHPDEGTEPWATRAPWLRREVRRLLDAEIGAGPLRGETGRGRGRSGATVSNEERGTADDIKARLKRDDPALYEQVAAGEIKADAAARTKGWRKPRVLLTSPASVAVRVRQHWTPEQVAELARLLTENP